MPTLGQRRHRLMQSQPKQSGWRWMPSITKPKLQSNGQTLTTSSVRLTRSIHTLANHTHQGPTRLRTTPLRLNRRTPARPTAGLATPPVETSQIEARPHSGRASTVRAGLVSTSRQQTFAFECCRAPDLATGESSATPCSPKLTSSLRRGSVCRPERRRRAPLDLRDHRSGSQPLHVAPHHGRGPTRAPSTPPSASRWWPVLERSFRRRQVSRPPAASPC